MSFIADVLENIWPTKAELLRTKEQLAKSKSREKALHSRCSHQRKELQRLNEKINNLLCRNKMDFYSKYINKIRDRNNKEVAEKCVSA
ncbi:MAG: hypothetical protein KDH96_01910 [Candidatus Riesia sp.]|nr:hypothetical protein [Candidatus Riesia sp.]